MKHLSSLLRGWPTAGLLLILLWLAGPVARAQAPAWQTAVAASGNFTLVRATATDAAGNVYITGDFSGTVSFDGIVLTEAGAGDVFVAKWSNLTSRFVWAQRAGGAGFDHSYSLALSGASVYIAGSFYGSTAAYGSTVLTSAGGTDREMFVAKLTDAGSSASFTWAKQAGGPNSDDAYAVAVSGTSVYVVGDFFSTTASFGGITLTNAGTTSYDAFVTRLTDAGSSASFDWAQRIGGTGGEYANSVAVSGGNVYVAGTFSSPRLSFGNANSGPLTNASTTGSDDIFVARFTDGGGFSWSRQAGGLGVDQAYGLAVTGTSVYLAGAFDSAPATFGSLSLATTGDKDGYVAKLTDSGSSTAFTWVQPITGAGGAFVNAIAVSGRNVVVAGSFYTTAATFGSTTLANASSSGTPDAFVAKLLDAGSTGTFAWALPAGGTGNDDAYSVALSGPNVYAAGAAAPPATFGSQTLTSTATGFRLGFLASLTDPTLTATTAAQGTLRFTLAPNPARATTTVQLPAQPGTAATLTLRDALGRTVRTATVALPPAGLRHELDLTGLPAGLYALQVRAGATAGTRRLVVE
ncbi:T9SS type A sorting domain-containing protein [Hymenobacter terricola]|uniref:T9SS type A sorting domain-containing protein n=1 Tax=Hymenobacter terricola TaxID=2819236 RepID=UPI001B30D59D|nr:T9SS type A sorting domain-containing protein [Hymenobacter terricola]